MNNIQLKMPAKHDAFSNLMLTTDNRMITSEEFYQQDFPKEDLINFVKVNQIIPSYFLS